MVRALALAVTVGVAVIAPACGAAEPTTAPGEAETRRTTTAAVERIPTMLRGRTFRYDDVRDCIGRAETSHGRLTTGPYAYVFDQIHAGAGILAVDVAVSDYALNGAQIGFAKDDADAAQLIDALRDMNASDAASPFAGWDIERRGNAVLFQLTDDQEVRRIIYGCLGGPPYAGDGGPTPSDDSWEPPPPPG